MGSYFPGTRRWVREYFTISIVVSITIDWTYLSNWVPSCVDFCFNDEFAACNVTATIVWGRKKHWTLFSAQWYQSTWIWATIPKIIDFISRLNKYEHNRLASKHKAVSPYRWLGPIFLGKKTRMGERKFYLPYSAFIPTDHTDSRVLSSV